MTKPMAVLRCASPLPDIIQDDHPRVPAKQPRPKAAPSQDAEQAAADTEHTRPKIPPW
jgi:hypothetical protein